MVREQNSVSDVNRQAPPEPPDPLVLTAESSQQSATNEGPAGKTNRTSRRKKAPWIDWSRLVHGQQQPWPWKLAACFLSAMADSHFL